MNERIKELALQAGLKREDLHYTEEQPPYIIVSYRGKPNNGDPLVKFAELIVQECLSAIVATNQRPSQDEDRLMFSAGLLTAIDGIKQHFGVEK